MINLSIEWKLYSIGFTYNIITIVLISVYFMSDANFIVI